MQTIFFTARRVNCIPYFCLLKILCSILPLCWLAIISHAQTPIYRSIDKAVGLPSNTVYDILQDKNGFIWIAHDKGLSQYDGFRFKNFKNSQQQGKSLSNLMEDAQGKIWCQNFTGQFFYTQDDSLQLCTQLPATGFYSPAGILNDTLLLSAGKASVRQMNTQTYRTKERAVPGYSSAHYAITRNNHYYFFNKETHQLFKLTADKVLNPEPAPTDRTFFFVLPTEHDTYYLPKYPDEQNNLQGVKSSKVNFQFPSKTFIQNALQVNDSTIALLTTNGFYLFKTDFTPILNQQALFFEGKNISTLLQDREGNWWLGTLNEGIYFIPNLSNQKKFEKISITAIEADTNEKVLYLGTVHNEVFAYSTQHNHIRLLTKQALNQEVLSIYKNKEANELAFASDQLYVVSNNQEIYIHLAAAVKDIQSFDARHYAIASSSFIGLMATGKTPTLLAWGKSYASVSGDAPNNYVVKLNAEQTRGRAVEVLNDTIYAATSNGLMMYTNRGVTELKYQGGTVIASDLEKSKNTVYVATFNQGILKVKNGKVEQCIVSSTTAPTSVYKVKIDEDNLWALTENGFFVYNLKTEAVKTINQTDGLPTDDLRDFVIMQDTLYLAGSRGLTYFPTNLSSLNTSPPTILLTEMLVNHQRVDLLKKLSLRPEQNDITLQYSVLSYKSGDQLNIFYRINKEEWIELDNSTRELYLPALSPNSYTIQLKAINEDGVESLSAASVIFTINKPFYLQAWFLIIVTSLLLIGLYFLHQYRLIKTEQKNKTETDRLQLEQALQQSLLASIKAQMNPHFIYNALSSIQSFVYSDDKANAIKYLDSFSELTRKVLELSSHETILLSEEIELLETYISLEKMRFGDPFHFTLTCDKTLDTHFVRLPSMIVQPFVENAIKHGLLHRKGEKHLAISFCKAGDELVISIDDNGVGRKTSAELKSSKNKSHTSFSMSANKKRLELLNTKRKQAIGLTIHDKVDELGRGSGTTVTITLPALLS